MADKRYYKIVKIIKAKNIKDAVDKEKKAEILEVFVPDKIPPFLEDLLSTSKKK